MTKPKVLFICIGNTCRSPMAEGLFRAVAGDRYEVASAGVTAEFGCAQSAAVAAMREKGVDISGHLCRLLDDFAGEELEAVFTLDPSVRADAKRLKKVKEFVHWDISDPFQSSAGYYRNIRDDLENRIRKWLESRDH